MYAAVMRRGYPERESILMPVLRVAVIFYFVRHFVSFLTWAMVYLAIWLT